MSEYVDQPEAYDVYTTGLRIGTTEPCRETKGSWWEVFKTQNGIIACVVTSSGVICGEKITKEELSSYVDDLDTANSILTDNT